MITVAAFARSKIALGLGSGGVCAAARVTTNVTEAKDAKRFIWPRIIPKTRASLPSQKPGYVLRQNVAFDIDAVARLAASQIRRLIGVGDDRDLHQSVFD